MRHLMIEEDRLDDFLLASAGVLPAQIGVPPEARAIAAARRCGFDIGTKRTRPVVAADFKQFDLLLAMNEAGADALGVLAPPGTEHKVHLLLDFSPWIGQREVRDPVVGPDDAFSGVLDLIRMQARPVAWRYQHRRRTQ